CELPTDSARRKALTQLPPTLNATYERILERVNNSNEHVRNIVQRTLLWIGFAYDSLTISELCEAVSISDNSTSLDPDDIVDEAEIARWCSSLVRKSSDGVRFEFAH